MTTTTRTITKEELEQYLPYRLKYQPEKDREGNIQEAYRTHLDPESKSGTPVAINIPKQCYYNFHYNQGGSLIDLLRQQGAPISQDTARARPSLSYRRQLAILAHTKSLGRSYRCGSHTALRTDVLSGNYDAAHRVMCLRWDCIKCAPFLKRVWTEHLVDYHCVAIYLVPRGYKGIGKALNRFKQRARRAGGQFEWWLLQSSEYQILFVDSRSDPRVKDWLDAEPCLERVALLPTIQERNRWMEEGLEKMDKPMAWNHKVRHSKGITSIKANVDDVNNTTREKITLSTSECWDLEMIKMRLVEVITQGKHQVEMQKDLGLKKVRAWLVERRGKQLEPYGVLELQMYEDGATLLLCDTTVDKTTFPSGQWDIADKTLEEVTSELESQGYIVDWLTEDIVRFYHARAWRQR